MPGTYDRESSRIDLALDALSDPRRRRLLTRLKDRNPLDHDAFPEELDADRDPDRVLLEMHHSHLPRLVEAGYVDWDRDEGVLRRGPRFDEVAPLIELIVEHRDELPAGWP